MKHSWDPGLYDSTHHYVFDYGKSLVEILAPQPGESILDIGCGTGHLTHQIADTGASVLGIDQSPEMVAQARQNYPKLSFQLASATSFRSDRVFDAVFSNATLHWVLDAEAAIRTIRAALKPGGRFVAEFGGKGNIASVVAAAGRNPWYFPSIGRYAGLLEAHALEVVQASLFDRPTKVEGEQGLREWVGMFYEPPLEEEVITRMESELRPRLFCDGNWFIDYKRLRIVAIAA